jgi:DNA-binding beta-propeller fold protein YncE
MKKPRPITLRRQMQDETAMRPRYKRGRNKKLKLNTSALQTRTSWISWLFLSWLLLFFSGCMKDDSIYNFQRLDADEKGKAVFIVNEGNFMYGNASLTYYNPDSNKVLNDIFYQTNALPLGDVANSMRIMDSLGFIVINNSGKIYVMNVNTFRYTGKITGLVSPRNIYILSRTKAYVTDLYAKKIYIVNPTTLQITGSISIDNHNPQFYQHSSEQMVFWGKYAFVNSWSYDDKVLVINLLDDKLVDSIQVVKQPNSMVLDARQRLWVLSDGGFRGSGYGQDTAALTCINPETRKIEKVFRFTDLAASPTRLCCNKAGDTLYFLYNSLSGGIVNHAGVYAFPVNASRLPDVPLISQGNHQFYGLGIRPENGNIYVSDARDYMSRGEVYIYSPRGQLLDSLQAGIIPGSFCFK